ncbi:MAG: bifunctional UDP-N-acetylglucosamine diphosphorylase/glucosamine-1-phosphate N-acetyltransferase GlmU [Elusimicrobia bacterium]|nr:bifunctional UDP-N-acetylglucosamine diphosphorylase/glucosamine-1-phosphate N-acetyltransferase GlmU [Elusimicrobiota bacterium]
MRLVTRRSGSHKGGGFCVLILAAGQGTRMESSRPKVLHPLGGRPIASYLLRAAIALKPSGIAVVVGHGAEEVQKAVQEVVKEYSIQRPLTFLRQKSLTGSGGAVLDAAAFLRKFETAMVLCGDTPLLTYETLFALLNSHRDQKGHAAILTAKLNHPKGYGRIVRGPLGDVIKIVEEGEASPKEAAIQEVNSGAYCFEAAPLIEAARDLEPSGHKREQYLTHCLERIRAKGGRISAFVTQTPEEILGINSRVQLAQAERILNRRILDRLMISGVTVIDPAHTYVEMDVEIERDTVLWPGTILRGRTRIGRECRIGPYTCLSDTTVGNGCEIVSSHVSGARILEKSTIGPFAHIRPETIVGPRAKVGNFSELKAARVGFGSKVPHLSYIGDCDIAEEVNVGAGTITCNYDGEAKHKTIIQAKAFIGSNVNLVAPVKVGRGAKIGAGSTITQDVPDGVLAIARAPQVNKER